MNTPQAPHVEEIRPISRPEPPPSADAPSQKPSRMVKSSRGEGTAKAQAQRAKPSRKLLRGVGPSVSASTPGSSPTQERASSGYASPTTFERVLHVLTALIPAIVAGTGANSVALAAHDDGVVRTVGAGFTGVFRALDLLIAAPFIALFPFGTRVFRASLSGAVLTAVCGALAFPVAQRLVRDVVPFLLALIGVGKLKDRDAQGQPVRLIAAVAAASVATALLSPPWQSEASAPGGAIPGAVLILLSLSVANPRLLALILGLAASYEPITFLAALAAVLPRAVVARQSIRKEAKVEVGPTVVAFVLGLTPLALGFALFRRPAEISLAVPMFTWIERAARPLTLRMFAMSELGFVMMIVCGAGLVLPQLGPRARVLGISSALVVGAGVLSIALKMPAGPNRFAAPLLAGILMAYTLAATVLGTMVLAIARARVPFAEASAALLVVLELALPVKALDDMATRRETHAPHAAAIWNDIAWGSTPPASVLLIADRNTMKRIASTRAVGAMRPDLVIVPSFDVQGREGEHALITEPKLAALYRDIALGVPPEELSLAQLGAQRPVLATFDPKWDRALSRHLVPVGLTSRFEPEPRGASDRKKALDQFLPMRDRLVRVTTAKKDAELAAATAMLLRARAIGMAATGERDILARALDDLRAFAPDDPVGTTLVRRIVTTKGPIDVHDLSP